VPHMDVTKLDRDVAHVASVLDEYCKYLFKMSYLFQTYVANVLIWMLHMFHTCVAKSMFQIFHLFLVLCCSKCFHVASCKLQVFI
jgi:hypothetical protein